MLRVILENIGGELDSRPAENEDDAARVAHQMISEAGVLYAGDVIRIVDDGEGE